MIHSPLPPPLRPLLIPQSLSTLGPPAAPSRRSPFAPSIASSQSSAEDLEIGRVENFSLFADDEWLPPFASQISSLIDLDITPPSTVSTPLSQTQFNARPQRNVHLPARFVSAESSAFSLPSQSCDAPVPLLQSLTLACNLAQPRLPQTDRESKLPANLAPVRKKARVLVSITSGAIGLAVMVTIASRTVSATRQTVSRSRFEPQTIALSRVEYHSRKFSRFAR